MTQTTKAADKPRRFPTPTRGEVAAARLILKRDRVGRGKVRITPRMREYAAYTGYDD